MRILELIRVAPDLYKAGARAVHLMGPPGIGKSEVIEHDITAALTAAHGGEEFGFHSMLAPTVDAPDIRGFLVPTKLADGTPSSFYTRPALLPTKQYLAKHPRGIYFIDERASADILVNKALAPVVLSKRFGDEYLPPGWQVWSASNRVEDQSGASKQLKMMTNRECQIHLQSDIKSWEAWAEAKGLHPIFIATAKAKPNIVFAEHVPKHDGPFCTARSFTAAAEYIGKTVGTDQATGNFTMKMQLDTLALQVMQGFVGEAACGEISAHIKLGDKLPEIDDILKDPMAAKCPDPKELHIGYMAAQLLLHYAKPDVIDKLWQYAERLPREIQVSTAQNLVARGGGVLLNSTRMTAWIQKNQALINVSNSKR